MKKFILVFALLVSSSSALAADISIATMQLSGNVPKVFSVTARGYPGDLDLNPSTTVVDRLMGILHFKYNWPIATIGIKSDTASGLPMNGATAFTFGTDMFFTSNGCTVIDTGAGKLDGATAIGSANVINFMAAGEDVNYGEQECNITASWVTSADLQKAGKYSMTITVTMTST